MSLNVSGASKLRMPASANKISVDISGSGEVTLSGNTDMLDLNVSGSGLADLVKLTAKEAEIKLEGAANAKVNVTEAIEAEASGASNLQYKGSPRMRKAQTSGAAEISGL